VLKHLSSTNKPLPWVTVLVRLQILALARLLEMARADMVTLDPQPRLLGLVDPTRLTHPRPMLGLETVHRPNPAHRALRRYSRKLLPGGQRKGLDQPPQLPPEAEKRTGSREFSLRNYRRITPRRLL